MKRRTLITTALVCCFMVCLAVVADLSGKWTGTLKGPDGNVVAIHLVFKVDGDKLTGTGQGDGDAMQIDSGKINGNEFSFTLTDPGGTVFKQSGKYYENGDSVSMNVEFNGNKLHSTLKREN
jgi:hypothetical protein